MASFELKSGQSLRKGIRRIARKQMEKALEQLTGVAGHRRDEVVHEARKCFKRIRAVARLVRPAIGERLYREVNYHFRDLGRPLTQVRDAKILIETLDALVDHFHDRVAGHSFDSVRKELQANLRKVRRDVLDEQDALAAVAAGVREELERVEQWTDVRNKWTAIGGGLRRVYKSARRAFAEADTANPDTMALHEWRKQTKYLRYQLEILQPVWCEMVGDWADQADWLGEFLGDDHDLAVLRQFIANDPKRFGENGSLEVLLALIERRRAELQRDANRLGERLYQDQPGEVARRLKGWWKSWQQESRQPQLA